MKKLMIVCSFMFVGQLSAGKWESRKQIASGLSKVAYERSRQVVNAQNFGKVYSQANNVRMGNAVICEEIPASRATIEETEAGIAKLKIASLNEQPK